MKTFKIFEIILEDNENFNPLSKYLKQSFATLEKVMDCYSFHPDYFSQGIDSSR